MMWCYINVLLQRQLWCYILYMDALIRSVNSLSYQDRWRQWFHPLEKHRPVYRLHHHSRKHQDFRHYVLGVCTTSPEGVSGLVSVGSTIGSYVTFITAIIGYISLRTVGIALKRFRVYDYFHDYECFSCVDYKDSYCIVLYSYNTIQYNASSGARQSEALPMWETQRADLRELDWPVNKTVVKCGCFLYVNVGGGGALVESMTLNWRVVDSTPALATT